MGILYNIGIGIYALLLGLAGLLGNEKAQKRIDGLRATRKMKKEDFPENSLWFHVASLGEYQQIKPLILFFKEKYPEKKIVLSFYSPSGFENVKDNLEDKRFYLPTDTIASMQNLVSIINAEALFLSKYEIWPNLLKSCNENNIPVFLLSAFYRPDHLIFKPWGKFLAKAIRRINHIHVMDIDSEECLREIYPSQQIAISGDMRALTSKENFEQNQKLEKIEEFLGESTGLIGGSIYENEVDAIMESWSDRPEKILLVPHDVDQKSILKIQEKIKTYSYQKLSDYNKNIDSKILLIDEMGYLKYMYQYAKLAYVGGGFGKGIHNLLEVAAYGIPMIYGPNNSRFPEAQIFQEIGIGIEIRKLVHLKTATQTSLAKNKVEVQKAADNFFIEQKEFATQAFDYFSNLSFTTS